MHHVTFVSLFTTPTQGCVCDKQCLLGASKCTTDVYRMGSLDDPVSPPPRIPTAVKIVSRESNVGREHAFFDQPANGISTLPHSARVCVAPTMKPCWDLFTTLVPECVATSKVCEELRNAPLVCDCIGVLGRHPVSPLPQTTYAGEIVSVVKQMWGMIFTSGRSVHVFRRSPDVQRLTRMNCDGNVQIHHTDARACESRDHQQQVIPAGIRQQQCTVCLPQRSSREGRCAHRANDCDMHASQLSRKGYTRTQFRIKTPAGEYEGTRGEHPMACANKAN